MQRKIVTIVALALFLMGTASLPRAAAQETTKEVETKLKPIDSYKLEFTVSEMENAKKTNSRTYSMRLRANALPEWSQWEQVRVGSRIPFAVEAGKYEYVDVGMNIDCRLLPMGNANVVVSANWGYSSLGGERMVSPSTQNPVVRQVRSNMEAVVPLDKPTVLAEVDDVTSTHYVFEVKVTKITP